MPLLHHWRTEWAVCDQLSLVSYSFLLYPFQGVVWLCSSPKVLSWEVHPNSGPCGFNPGVQLTVAVTEPPAASSKSLQVAPPTQLFKLGKYTLLANPIYWPHTLCSQVSVQKAGKGRKSHGLGEEKLWRIRGGGCSERRVSWANVSSCC